MTARVKPPPAEVKAGEFKAKCLELMDRVAQTGATVVITKRGTPVARLVPAVDRARSVFGFAAGSFEEIGDIIAPAAPEWRAEEREVALLEAAGRGRRSRSPRARRRAP